MQKILLLSFTLLCAHAWADKPVDNDSVAGYGSANEIFKALGFEDSDNSRFNIWKSITESQGIFPCKPLNEPAWFAKDFRVDAGESGVLTDEKRTGRRSMHIVPWRAKDTRKQFVLSFSYDWNKDQDGKVVCGFELFIRTPENRMIGVGIDKDGKVLKEIPTALAHDKNAAEGKETITSGKGCFKCHPRVSYGHNKEAAELFWGPKEGRTKNPDLRKDQGSHSKGDPNGFGRQP